ncbi:hypothetical protein NK553_25895 [Pseudomonas sp. ZM23]|uniref:Transmembrane protein n=1 Tax=Pseudomonas triclosanedens TaxID=2961893 RepID=A0ABY6ZZ10_9PSED|nr:hypothetical protein [Pseudomonas triclosanedens]MCP8467389.1 hypothetical protein [Pseudomonas triclosanedens]MCP8469911.1 hypothetical protein [Pseudomonas triclosanedens]MCP8478778.1 hypothetical protein [Pseudomonas triclosanedens]WAI49240.1 hypothetical protein OU419_26425 [Pseudomonas triclosanedens]
MLDFIFVMTPFFLAVWLVLKDSPDLLLPSRNDPVWAKFAGLSFILFGASMFLRLALLGRQLPAGKYTMRLMTTGQTLGFCLFMVAIGALVLFAHKLSSKRR